MRARGREVYIIAGIIAVVLIVAWWFLLFNPKRSEIAQKDEEISQARTTLAAQQQQLVRLEEYKKTAPQARVEVVRAGKVIPEGEGQPSLIVELNETADLAGVNIQSLSRGDVKQGQPFGVQSMTATVNGRFFDMVDFLYRVENYVAIRNTKVKVTGRLLQITSMQVSGGGAVSSTTSSASDPSLTVTLTINGYIWGGAVAPAASTATGGAS
jgi:Tfp pilus assembly protein PilO